MKKLYSPVLLILSCLFIQNTVAQHTIRFETEGLRKGDTCALYGYKNGMPLLLQSAIVDKPEIIVLNDATAVAEGIYMLLLPLTISKNLISIVYSKQENKNIEIRYYENNENTIFKDSQQNSAYASYIQASQKFYATQHNLEEDFLNSADSIERKKIRNKAIAAQQFLYDYGKRIENAYIGSVVAKLIACTNTLPIPDIAWSGEHLMYNLDDAVYQNAVNFIIQHYWEGVDFADNTLANTPYLSGKTAQYISFIKIEDNKNVILAIDALLKKTAVNATLYHVIQEALLNLYLVKNSTYFNEEIGIHLLKNEQNQIFTPDWRKEIINSRISFIEKNKIGTIAADLCLEDQKGVKKSLANIKSKYTVLYFFNPDCSHCMQVSPIVKEWLSKEAPKDISLLAIYVDNNEKEWRKYIKENTFEKNWLNLWGNTDFVKIRTQYWIDNIPSIYLLDQDKKVLLKDVNYKQLINYFSKP